MHQLFIKNQFNQQLIRLLRLNTLATQVIFIITGKVD
ncbi:Uncharacterised protein [Yersinia aldovae]|uniref:Uncharacterized protein n=1 Tax=Yersinia aldovae TaxID=29483 RepID=A0A0T9TG08_YERAL|nr:hypothetical protein AT01_3913 [Yersinia aldovae 670-83]CNK80686.1 Uncharacterised protein [Yersinia aldovae]